MTDKSLLNHALSLTNQDKLELVESLLKSIPVSESLESEMVQESESRWEAFKNGQITSSSHEEVFKRLRNR